MTDVYSLLEIQDCSKLHIFRGDLNLNGGCSKDAKSCCGLVAHNVLLVRRSVLSCLSEKAMIEACISKHTAPVCAHCEEHVFKKFQDKFRDRQKVK